MAVVNISYLKEKVTRCGKDGYEQSEYWAAVQ
jgi:predicted fused transcriptional regulator/phosphomethylpyrimidine kinase